MTEETGGAEAVAAAIAGAKPGEPADVDDRALADLERNDWGNAQRLLARHGHNLMVIEELHRDSRDGWYHWNGQVWRSQGAWAQARRLAHETARAIVAEARALEADPPPTIKDFGDQKSLDEALARRKERIKAHHKWAVSSGNSGKVDAMLKAAATYLLRSQEELNADARRLTVANGTLELREDGTVVLGPHDRADLITQIAEVDYDEDAECPTYEAMLARVQPDAEVRGFLQRLGGYCLTGDIGEQKIVCWYGHGANGKSAVLTVWREVMGDMALTLPFSTFAADDRKRGGDATPDIARLPGKRVALASEPEVGTVLSESAIKTQASGEPLTARPLFGNQIEFMPTHKLILSFNNKPKVKGQDHGTWRRLVVVPWDQTIPEEEQDPQLARKILRAEKAGVLRWLIDGYRDWCERGLAVPDSVARAAEEYRSDSDPLADFFADLVIQGEDGTGGEIPASQFFEAYCTHSKANGREPINNTRFGKLLVERGIKREKIAGIRVYKDVRLDIPVLEGLEAKVRGDDGQGGF